MREITRAEMQTYELFGIYLTETEQDLSGMTTAPQSVVEDFCWWVECRIRSVEWLGLETLS